MKDSPYIVNMYYLDSDWTYELSLHREFADLHEALKCLFILGSRYPKEIVKCFHDGVCIAEYDERGVTQ